MIVTVLVVMEAADGVVEKLFMGNTSAGVLTGVIIGSLAGIGVAVLVGVNVNVFVAAMTAFEFAMPSPSLEGFRC